MMEIPLKLGKEGPVLALEIPRLNFLEIPRAALAAAAHRAGHAAREAAPAHESPICTSS
jgi:hypothetical protein